MSFFNITPQLRKIIVAVEQKHSFHTFKSKIKSDQKVLSVISKNFVSQRFNQNICWRCGLERTKVTAVFCEECHAIQSPHETRNYFRVFDLEEKFDIDKNVLRDKYRRLQSDLHPDKFTNKSEEEKAISANFSSLVNNAYNSLQIPLKRAEHLLELKGDKLAEEQKLDDPEFLMEMMELNEELESTSDPEKLKQLNIKNKNILEIIARNIDECFRRNDLKQAKYFVIKLKYYSSLGNRINAVLRESGIVD